MPADLIINPRCLSGAVATLILLTPLRSLRSKRPLVIFTKMAKTAAMPSI